MHRRRSTSEEATSIDFLYRIAPMGVSLSLALSIVYTLLIWPVVAQGPLAIWLATGIGLSASRLYRVSRYLAAMPRHADQRRWRIEFNVFAVLSGILWGLAAIFFFPEAEPRYQVFTIVMLCGTAAAAVATLAAEPLCYRAYLFVVLGPLVARLVMRGDATDLSLAFLIAFFMLSLEVLSGWMGRLLSDMHQAKQGDRYQRDVMEMLAKGAPLSRTLHTIVRGIEDPERGTTASIVLLDVDKRRALIGAAPGLPDYFLQAIESLEVGPEGSALGVAIFHGQRLLAEDVRDHPAWRDLRDAALNAGLQACWSEPIKSATGEVLGSLTIYRNEPGKPNVDDIRRLENAAHLAGLAVERQRMGDDNDIATLVYRNSSEGMVVTNADGDVIAINEAFVDITGYALDDIRSRKMGFAMPAVSDADDYREMMAAVRATGRWQGVLWSQRKTGERFASRAVINSTHDNSGRVTHHVILISDITEQKRSDELIWRQANYDPLIGLPNRRLFRDRLEQEIKKAHRSGRRMGLLFLDLDHFKEINDTLGHDMGDVLLIEAAKRISSCVRDSDTVARLGGDEFTVILSEIEDNKIIERVADAIIEEMVRPFHLGEEVVYISVSIGITVFPDDSRELDELLKYADLAMYAAKNGGRNRFSYFTSATQNDAQQRLQMISDLRGALGAGQFSLHYQPVVDMRSQQISRAEALLRWKHPRLGLIGPAQFIQRAEESGLINDIGDWVFREVARVSKRWTELTNTDFQVSFNVSATQLRAAHACENWLNFLVGLGVRGSNITIELTEKLLLDSPPRVIETIHQLQNAGINIAIDDFGTGYSSLSYLKKFDIDYLKIDRSFVRDLTKNESDRALAETIIVMGHKLGVKVVAEGVENYQQGHILATAGCDYAQGNLFSRPVPEAEFETLLLRNAMAFVKA